jgi:hypothetical protein
MEQVDRVIRPKAVVLPDSALVRGKSTISPPPNQFTHEVTRAQPYFAFEAGQADAPDGQLDPNLKVVLLRRDGDWCYVAVEDGRLVKTACSALRGLY